MSLLQLIRVSVGEVGVQPGSVKMLTTDNLATITAVGYLNGAANQLQGIDIAPSDVIECLYSFNASTGAGTYAVLTVSISHGVITLVSSEVIAASTSSATPGTLRALVGNMSGTAAVMTSGNLVGVRGEVDAVGASGGYLYGVQGKVIPTGTLSGSSWSAGVFGQFDLSNATINAGQIAALWGDMGASGGTFTNVTGARGIALTNTISTLTLFAMDYRYGKASNLFELDGSSSTYIASGGAGGLSGTIKKIAISIDGVQYYIPAATVVS